MQTSFQRRPSWVQLLIFIGMAFGIFMVGTMLGGVVLAKMAGMSVMSVFDAEHWNYDDPKTLFILRGMILLQFLFLFIVPVFVFAYISDPSPARYLGLNTKTKSFYFIAGIMLLLISLPLAGWLGDLNQKIPLPHGIYQWMKETEDATTRQVEFMLGAGTAKNMLLNLVFIAVFAGIGEELFFRGVLQRLFIKMFRNPWAGIIITGFIFSAIHMQFFGFFPRFMLGILLGVIYWYSGSIWTAIIAHFVYDGLIVIISYIKPESIKEDNPVALQGISMAIVGLISLGLVAGLVIWMRKKSENSFEKVYVSSKETDHPFSF